MFALQNQDKQAHIDQTNKKAVRIQKKIASTIQLQEDDLDRRRNEARIKREESQKKKKESILPLRSLQKKHARL